MNLQLDQVIFNQIDKILAGAGLSPEMYRMVQCSLNLNCQTREVLKWAHLTCKSCECVGGNLENALPGAIAMEFFALAADIFDDVQDQDHDDLPWRKLPKANAINLAICLLMLSFKAITVITDDRLFREVNSTLYSTGTCASDGQFLECLYERHEHVRLEQYFQLIRQKSGSLTACACKLGAVLGRAPEVLVQSLFEFGFNFGVMRQIQNDSNDFLDFDKKNDFLNSKKTLPYVYLLHTLEGDRAEEFMNLTKWKEQGFQKFRNEQREQLKRIVAEEGVTQFCSVMCEIYRQKAQEILEGISVPEEQKEKMKELVREIV